MARLRPGLYRAEWFMEVSSQVAPSFNATVCENGLTTGLASVCTLQPAVASTDPGSSRNPFARMDRYLLLESGRAKATAYLSLPSETDEHQLNLIAATAFKSAFGGAGADWSVEINATAFDGDTSPPGFALRSAFNVWTLGLVNPPSVGQHIATFQPYERQESAPPPSAVTVLETPQGRDAPSSLADRAGESLSTIKNALVGPNGLDTNIIPLEYKIAGAVVLGIAGLIAVGYAAKQLKGII